MLCSHDYFYDYFPDYFQYYHSYYYYTISMIISITIPGRITVAVAVAAVAYVCISVHITCQSKTQEGPIETRSCYKHQPEQDHCKQSVSQNCESQ